MSFRLIPYQRKFAADVKACAMESWRFTYRDIFAPEQITEYVNRFYSEENGLQAEELISQKLLRYTIALDQDDRLIGFQTASIQQLQAELMRIYVLPGKIGMGAGSALLNDAENFFRTNGFKSYMVKVHRENILAQKFYERHGFVFVTEDATDHLVLKKIF